MAATSSKQGVTVLTRPLLARSSRHCSSTTSRASAFHRRSLSTTIGRPIDGVINRAERPRWSYTPQAMQAPIRTRKKDPRFEWQVNSDPKQLDRMYNRLLGPGGDSMLTEEVKWLAVTHKSFDHGRRGYNDRLAFLGTLSACLLRYTACIVVKLTSKLAGRRIVNLEASLALIKPSTEDKSRPTPLAASLRDTPFEHPDLEGIQMLTADVVLDLLSKKRLAALASRNGLADVVRWIPKRVSTSRHARWPLVADKVLFQPYNLVGSGEETILTEALFAIVGAVSLQKGGQAAAKVARDRILSPLGISS